MNLRTLTLLAACGGLLATAASAAPEPAKNLALHAKVSASSVLKKQYGPEKAVDGAVNNDSRWIGKEGDLPQTLTVDLGSRQAVGCIQLAMGWENGGEWNSWTRSFAIQYWDGRDWQTVPGADIKDNNAITRKFLLATPIQTEKVRVVARDKKAIRLAELWIFAPSAQGYPPLPELKQSDSIEGGVVQPAFKPVKTILANQSGYNLDWPKRFTAPLAEGEKEFTITPAGAPDQVLYRGTVKDGLGDFSDFRPSEAGREYVIHVQDGRSSDTTSDPFTIAPYHLERISFEPALRFMIDSRSVVGTHPSAFGGGPWRDSTFYTYELPSLVMLYLANPDVYEQAPIEMNWQADKARVMDPAFKMVSAHADDGALETTRRYYQELDPPVGKRVPDLVQLIHWGAGYWMLQPVVSRKHGVEGEVKPRQSLEQLAYFLYGYPWYQKYISEAFFKRISDFTFERWEKSGLLEVQTEIGDFKGRECPGHTILPNLMMHEVAKRLGRPDAQRYLDAAVAQTKWVVEKLDLKDPLVTKGQRMSEHMLITGLTIMLRDYPEAAPAGLRAKLAEWAGIMIARSGNMWDFRRYDDQYWALPATTPNTKWTSTWNEPGNICAFPALCFAVAAQLDDQATDKRLEQLAAAHWDNWFGRNPIGAHAGYKGPQDFPGVERGWPVKFPDNNCARLELVRGTINATAATDHYPFNPAGKFRHVEGWTAFNAAFNVGLSYSVIHDTTIELMSEDFASPLRGVKAGGKMGVRLRGPLAHPAAKKKTTTAVVSVSGADGDVERLTAQPAGPDGVTFQAVLPVVIGAAVPGDGILQVKSGDKIAITHGYGFFRASREFPLVGE